MKIKMRLEQLLTAVKTSNKISYPIVFSSAVDFDKFVSFIEKEGLK